MTVHAHPDDEASKGAGTVARYHAEGIHTVLVTCTGGEEGEILNPAMDQPGVMDRLPDIRREELYRAARIIGYDEVVLLGYRDSGMPDSPANSDPRSFAAAPLDEAVGRLVAVIRRTRPQVIDHLPAGTEDLPASRPSPGERGLRAGVRRGRRSRSLPRGRFPVAAASAVLRALVGATHPGYARQVCGAGHGLSI